MAYIPTAYTPSSTVNSYKKKQDDLTDKYYKYSGEGYTPGSGGFGKQINSASQRLNNLYNGNTISQEFTYNNQVGYDKAMSDVANRKPFEYDLSKDMLYQQAKEQYQAMGKTAMQDTIGQASAMTGGYGNSYATSAGALAYNNYLQQLNNSIGDYYAMALSGYNAETDRLNNIYNMYSADRSQSQNEWANNWNVYNNLYNLYSNDYWNAVGADNNAWAQKGSNLYNAAQLATDHYSTASNNDIGIWQQNNSNAYNQAQLSENARQHNSEMAYKYKALADDNAYKSKALKTKNTKNASNGSGNNTIKPTSTKSTTAVINKIDNELDGNRFMGSGKKTTKEIALSIIDNNKTLSKGEKAYLYEYYGLYREG